MSSATLLASTVMNAAASAMNDTAKVTYTFTAQLPYLNMALRILREVFEQNSVAVTQKISTVIQMDAGSTTIEFDVSPLPELPDDFVEPIQLWERTRDIDPWIPMRRVDFLSHDLEGQPLVSSFIIFQWDNQIIRVLESNQDNDIKMDYIAELFQAVTADTSSIGVVNAQSYLSFKTAALMKKLIERDLTAADLLEQEAELALNRSLGISSKSKQAINTRRRPFRQNYKRNRVIV